MPLNKDTVSVSLAQGINQKVDERIQAQNQMTMVKNRFFDKEGALRKRYGQTAQGQTIQTDFPNPLGFAANGKSKVFEHEDQLCVLNNGALYSQIKSQNKWAFKGHAMPVEVSAKKLASNITFIDTVTVGGVTVAVSSTYVYVIEDQTGNILKKTLITTNPSADFVLKLVAFSNAVYALACNQTTSDLYAYPVALTTGVVGSRLTIATDFTRANTVSVSVTSAASLAGEVAFIAYKSSSNIKVLPLTSAGSVSGLGVLDTGISTTTGMSVYVEPSDNPNRLFLSFIINGTGVRVGAWTFTASAYTVLFAVYTLDANAAVKFKNVAMAISPVTSQLYVFYSTYVLLPSTGTGSGTTSSSQKDSLDSIVYYSVTTVTGTSVSSQNVYGIGYELCAKPIRDVVRSTIYLPVTLISDLQPTCFLMDVLKGNSTTQTWAIAKFLDGYAAQVTQLSDTTLSSTGVYKFTNNGYVVTLNFLPSYSVSSQFMAKTTHFTGGLLWAYDGDTISEHNFLSYPERCDAFAGTNTVAVTQTGAGSLPQIFTLTCGFGRSFPTSKVTNPVYIAFNTASAGYYIWFGGTDPAIGGRTGINVGAVSSTLNQSEIAELIRFAVSASGALVSVSQSGATLTFTNTTNGAATAPSLTGFATGVGQSSAGSYQFKFCYRWTDRNGNIYRSNVSAGFTITIPALVNVALLVWAPPVYNKTGVVLEVYMTQVNGSVFYLQAEQALDATKSRYLFESISFVSTGSTLILYTNGGVLNSFNLGAVVALSTFKNRLLATISDDPSAIYYSKSNVIGEPINFSDFNVIRFDSDGDPITGHAQIDDKLAVFKDELIFVTAGDGSNDLGQNESFQQPIRIPGDIGCANSNSIVLTNSGLIFQSAKGIYTLNRSMGVEYVGAAVDDYKSFTVSSAVLVKNFDHVIFGLQDSNDSLVFNYLFGRWSIFSSQGSDSACTWTGKYVRVKNLGKVFVENTNYYDTDGSNLDIQSYAETPWLKLKNLQSFQRIYSIMFLGKYLSAHTLTFELLYDYVESSSTAYVVDATAISALPPFQVLVSPARQKCESIKIKITETPGTGSQECAVWNALDMQVGLKNTLNKTSADKSV
jgi:hypothetical protein